MNCMCCSHWRQCWRNKKGCQVNRQWFHGIPWLSPGSPWPAAHCAFPQSTILLCCRRYLQLLDGYRDICMCVLAWVPVTVCECVGVLLVWCGCACMCTCACACMCTCACAHVCMCACMCVGKGMLTYRCIPTYVYIVCMCVYMQVHVLCMHVGIN